MALSTGGRRFRRRKKEDVVIEGYFCDHAVDVAPGIDRNEEIHHLFGKDSPETDIQHNVGQLTIGVLDKFVNNSILDLITGQDPGVVTPAGTITGQAVRHFNVQDLTAVTVWSNMKDQQNTKYLKSWMITSWLPGFPMPAGNPNDKATFTLQGNGGLPRMFDSAWIKAKKLVTGAATITDTPVLVPNTGGQNAVSVRALREFGGVFEQQEISVSPTMITGIGGVTWSEIVPLATDLSGAITHLYVMYLQTGAGVYPAPAATSDKLRT